MIFESMGSTSTIKIVDANAKERVGGQIFAYEFPKQWHLLLPCEQDSPMFTPSSDFCVATRFPDTAYMARTFDLAENRGLYRTNNLDSTVTGDPFKGR